MQTALTTSDGLRLVLDRNPGDGVPVVMLHGGGQNRHSWSRLAQALNLLGHETLAVDQRGHGDSEWSATEDYDFVRFGEDLVDVLHLVGRPSVLVGASLGGVASLSAASSCPSLVERVILVDITTRPHLPGVSRIQTFMRAHMHGFLTIEEATEAVNAYLAHRSKPSDAASVERNLRRHGDGRWYWHWDPRVLEHRPTEDIDWTSLDRAARALDMPVLLVRGQYSDVVMDADVRYFRELVPHAEVAVVPDAQHMVAGDRNDAFVDVIVSYLHPNRGQAQ